jgi:hypothetical protein
VQAVGNLLKGKGDVQGVLVLGEEEAILVKTGGPGSELPLSPILVFICHHYSMIKISSKSALPAQ